MAHEIPQIRIVLRKFLHRGVDEADRLQGLAQIVTRGRQKAALGPIGAVGFLARRDQGIADGTALGHVANRRRDQGLVAIAKRRQANACGKFAAVGAPRKQVVDSSPHFAARRLSHIARQVRAVTCVKSLRNQHFEGLANELLGGIPEYTAGRFVGKSNDAEIVHHEHRVGRELQQPLRNGANFGHYRP